MLKYHYRSDKSSWKASKSFWNVSVSILRLIDVYRKSSQIRIHSYSMPLKGLFRLKKNAAQTITQPSHWTRLKLLRCSLRKQLTQPFGPYRFHFLRHWILLNTTFLYMTSAYGPSTFSATCTQVSILHPHFALNHDAYFIHGSRNCIFWYTERLDSLRNCSTVNFCTDAIIWTFVSSRLLVTSGLPVCCIRSKTQISA